MFYALQGAPLDGGNTAEINYQWQDDYSMANQLTNENTNPSPTLQQNAETDYPLQSQEYQAGVQQYSLPTQMTNQLGADALSYNPNVQAMKQKPPAKPSLSEMDMAQQQHPRNVKAGNKFPMYMEQTAQKEHFETESDDESEDEELMRPENGEDNMLLLLIGLGILLIAYLLHRNGFQF